MTRFIARRLLVTIPVVFGLVFIVFALARVIPGDPCRAVLGERATDAVCDDFIHRYGLDQPIPIQFGLYLGQLAQGDLGDSIKHSQPVTQLLIERLPTTIELTLLALLFAVVVGIPLGLLSAYRRNSPIDVGIDDRRQHRRLDAGLRARPPASVRLRAHPQGDALRAPALRPAVVRRRGHVARRGLAPRDRRRAACAACSTSSPGCTSPRRSSPASGAPSATRCATSSCR